MQIKILCLNLLWGGKFMDRILDFLRTQDADILLLQEAYASEDAVEPRFDSISHICKNIPAYTHYDVAIEFFHNTDEGRHAMCNAVVSQYPLKALEPIYFDGPAQDVFENKRETIPDWPRNLQRVQIDVKGTILNVFNTHGVWGEDGGDNPRRLAMSAKIIDAVKGKNNVILGGDFNIDENTRSIQNIESHLKNIFKQERKTSFNMRQKHPPLTYATAVVDFLFVSPDVNVVSHESPDVDVSDHLPLVATIEVA